MFLCARSDDAHATARRIALSGKSPQKPTKIWYSNKAGRFAEALSEQNTALARDPANSLLLVHKGIILRNQGHRSAARTVWQQVLQREKTSPAAAEAGRLLAEPPDNSK